MYAAALRDYRTLIHNFRAIDFATLSAAEALRWDTQRSRLHNRLKLLGRQIGKTEKTVFAEILGCDRDLSEYGLPEFGLIGREDLAENRFFEQGPGDYTGHIGQSEMEAESSAGNSVRGKGYREVNDLRPGEIGLVFVRQVSKAVKLPNPDVITTRGNLMEMDGPTTREAIRRAKRFAAENGYMLLRYNTFAHEYTEDIYAIVVDEDSLNLATDQIKRMRNEYGIREEDMPREVIDMDWREHQTRIDLELEDRFGRLPAEVGRMLYDHEWRRVNDPNYLLSDTEVRQELQRVLRSNNFKLVDGKVVRVSRRAKDRREQERSVAEESKGLFRRR